MIIPNLWKNKSHVPVTTNQQPSTVKALSTDASSPRPCASSAGSHLQLYTAPDTDQPHPQPSSGGVFPGYPQVASK